MEATIIESSRVEVRAEHRTDGSVVLTNALMLPQVHGTIPGRLRHWASERPDAPFLSQGDRLISFAQAEAGRRDLAARLLALNLSLDRPLMIVADNGINHALLMLAATSVAVPVAIVSSSYVAANAGPWAKFKRIFDQIRPGLIAADAPDVLARALGDQAGTVAVEDIRDLAWLETLPLVPSEVLVVAEQGVNLDTVAKLLFTSGSTGQPKAVPNTQRMMVSNMLGLSVVWPFLSERPPVSVDWLPWNHTFGGNCCFNTTLWFGGHAHIDSGRPTPALVGRSVEAIRTWRPTLYYNVPVGFEAILPELECDDAFAADFFANLDFIFNGGAPLPAALRSRVEAVALRTAGRVPRIVAGWGSTETAPFSTVLYFDQPHANNLGAPMPGTQIKMVPCDERYELRVKGPNVMPGYWGDPAATGAAYDDERFYKIGDAGKFVDPADPAQGILFDGRVAENFKLTSGTWVNVGALRLAVVSVSEKLISDAVVTGEGRAEVGMLLFLNENACRSLIGKEACASLGNDWIGEHPQVRARIKELLSTYNAQQIGSSTRVVRFSIVKEPPSAAHDEITDKGYLNQRRVLSRRADLVEALYLDDAMPG
jgi:feruloyl-CoA synthase